MGLRSFGKVTILSPNLIAFGEKIENGLPLIQEGQTLIFAGTGLPRPLSTQEVYFAKNVEHTDDANKCSLLDSSGNEVILDDLEGFNYFEVLTAASYEFYATAIINSNIQAKTAYKNYDTVTFFSSDTLPAPLIENAIYSLINVTNDSFQIAESTGGDPLAIDEHHGVIFIRTAYVPLRFIKKHLKSKLLGDTYLPLVTPVRATHLENLRTRINNELIRRSKPTYTFTTDPAIAATTTPIKAQHVRELRIGASCINALIPVFTTDPTLIENVTKIKAVHFQEIDNWLTIEEAKLPYTYTCCFTSTSTWTAPANVTTSVCVWGIGGGGGGGKGGTGGTGQAGGNGGWGGDGGCSSLGGCGGCGGCGGKAFKTTGTGGALLIGGAGGGGGGSGMEGSAGTPGGGGGSGTCGLTGCPGCPGLRGNMGSGNLLSYPASPCAVGVLPFDTLNICIGTGGAPAASGNPTYVCKGVTQILCASGGTCGCAGSTGSGQVGRAAGGGTPGAPPDATGNGAYGFPGGNVDCGWTINPAVYNNTGATAATGGKGGCDGGNGLLAGGGGGGGGSVSNWVTNRYNYAAGGAGGYGRAGGGGGAGLAQGASNGISGTGGAGGGSPYGAPGAAGQGGGGSTGLRSGGAGGNSVACGGRGGNQYLPSWAEGGRGGSGSNNLYGGGYVNPTCCGGGARTDWRYGSAGATGGAGCCGWCGYGASGCGGQGGTGGWGGYGGAGGRGGAGAPRPSGNQGGGGGAGATVCTNCGNSCFAGSTGAPGGGWIQCGRIQGCPYEVGGDGQGGGSGVNGGSGTAGLVIIKYLLWE